VGENVGMRRAWILLALTVLAVMVLAACRGGTVDPTASGTPVPPCAGRGLISVGEQLPSCSFEGMSGEPVLALASLRGKPAILNWWASWCAFCVQEMPDFERVHQALGDRVAIVGLNLLGTTQGETRGAAETFRRSTGVSYGLAYDTEGRLYAQFQPNLVRPTMPITVFVDAQGRVVERHFGPFTESQLRAAIQDRFGIA